MPRIRSSRGVIAASLAAVLFTPAALGQTAWDADTGDWSVDANWLNGEPAADTLAEISNGGTAQVTQAGEQAGLLTLGFTGGTVTEPGAASGRLEVSAGDLTINGSGTQGLYVGDSEGNTGYVGITGGSVSVLGTGADLVVGRSGTGSLDMSAGTVTVADNYIVGNTTTGEGTVNQTGGDTTLGGTLFVGGQGVGTYTFSGDSINAGAVTLGNAGSATGTLTVNSGTVDTTADLTLGNSGNGTLTVNGGTVQIGDGTTEDLRVGQSGTGTLNLTAGNVTVNDNLLVAANGGASNGTVTQDGGSLTTNGSVFVAAQGTGSYTLNDGSLTSNVNLFVGRTGTADGTFNQNGGTVTTTNNLIIGDFAESQGEYKLAGGTLTVGMELRLANFSRPDAGANGELTITGGTLNTTRLTVAPSLDTDLADNELNTATFTVTGDDADINVSEFFIADTDRATLAFNVGPTGISTVDVASSAFIMQAMVDMGLTDDASPMMGDTFDLLTAATIDGTPTLLAEDMDDWSLAIVSGGNGQTLQATFTAIPEPASLALVALGGTLMLGRRRAPR